MTLSEWKSFSITQEVMLEFKRRQNEAKDYLAEHAGIDSRMDAMMVGAIKAYADMLDIELDEESQIDN